MARRKGSWEQCLIRLGPTCTLNRRRAGWLKSVHWLTRRASSKAWAQAPQEAADALAKLPALHSWAAVLLGRAAGSGAGSNGLLWKPVKRWRRGEKGSSWSLWLLPINLSLFELRLSRRTQVITEKAFSFLLLVTFRVCLDREPQG